MKKNKKGFTLVELVIVVAVMAVLIAVAIPTVSSITTTAQRTVVDTNARTIESTIKLAEAELSKEGDGTVALKTYQIADALTSAKLGITSGSYIYDSVAGTVVPVYEEKYLEKDEVAAAVDADTDYAITFATADGATTVTVTYGTKKDVDQRPANG